MSDKPDQQEALESVEPLESLTALKDDVKKHPAFLSVEHLTQWLKISGLKPKIAGIITKKGADGDIDVSDPAIRTLLHYIFSLQERDLIDDVFDKVSEERFAKCPDLPEIAEKKGDKIPEKGQFLTTLSKYRGEIKSGSDEKIRKAQDDLMPLLSSIQVVADHYDIVLDPLLTLDNIHRKTAAHILVAYDELAKAVKAKEKVIDKETDKSAKAKAEAEKRITTRPVNPTVLLYYLIRKEYELTGTLSADELHAAAAKGLSEYAVTALFAFDPNQQIAAPHAHHNATVKKKIVEFARQTILENARLTFGGVLKALPVVADLSPKADHHQIEHCFNPPAQEGEGKKPAAVKTQDIIALAVYLRKQATEAREGNKIHGIRTQDLHDVEHFVETLEKIVSARMAGTLISAKEEKLPETLPALVQKIVSFHGVLSEKNLNDLKSALAKVKPLKHEQHGDAPFFEKAGRATAVAAIIAQIGEMIKWAMDWLNVDGNKGGGAKKDDHGHSGGHP